MGTDVERITKALKFTHDIWACAVEVFVAAWLLQRQLSWAFVMPLVVCVGQ
jgi:ATP-binding cassette, subfamily C (CFTR/MRP), member 1